MKIIDLAEEKRRRELASAEPVNGDWLFSLDVYAPVKVGMQHTGIISKMSDAGEAPTAEQMRRHADALSNLADILRDQANAIEPDDDGKVLSRTTIFESSRVRVWISDEIKSPEQHDWLTERYADALIEANKRY